MSTTDRLAISLALGTGDSNHLRINGTDIPLERVDSSYSIAQPTYRSTRGAGITLTFWPDELTIHDSRTGGVDA